MKDFSITLSDFQIRRLRQLANEIAQLQKLQNESMTAILAAECDPETLAGWTIEMKDNQVTCTPPAPAEPGPSLVQ